MARRGRKWATPGISRGKNSFGKSSSTCRELQAKTKRGFGILPEGGDEVGFRILADCGLVLEVVLVLAIIGNFEEEDENEDEKFCAFCFFASSRVIEIAAGGEITAPASLHPSHWRSPALRWFP